jgi:phosphonopyruvate decarboxylase
MALNTARAQAGPTCIHIRMARGSLSNLGRPTIKPQDVARRFK